jgi:hypothetical protein
MPIIETKVLRPQIAAKAGGIEKLIGSGFIDPEAGRQTAAQFLAAAGEAGFDQPEENLGIKFAEHRFLPIS